MCGDAVLFTIFFLETLDWPSGPLDGADVPAKRGN